MGKKIFLGRIGIGGVNITDTLEKARKMEDIEKERNETEKAESVVMDGAVAAEVVSEKKEDMAEGMEKNEATTAEVVNEIAEDIAEAVDAEEESSEEYSLVYEEDDYEEMMRIETERWEEMMNDGGRDLYECLVQIAIKEEEDRKRAEEERARRAYESYSKIVSDLVSLDAILAKGGRFGNLSYTRVDAEVDAILEKLSVISEGRVTKICAAHNIVTAFYNANAGEIEYRYKNAVKEKMQRMMEKLG